MRTLLSISHFVSIGALVLAGAGTLALPASQARSQEPVFLGNENVTVDLSVLDDGGYGVSGPSVLTPPRAIGGRRLLVPGAAFPVSRLHVPAPPGSARPAAPEPAGEESRVARTPPAVPKAPRLKTPAKPETASAVPSKPPQKPTIAAAIPAPAPAPPPPPPVKKARAAPKAEQTAAAAAAPPPPPPAVSPAKKPKTAAVKPKKEPPAPEQASLPPAGTPLTPGRAARVLFPAGVSKLPGAAKDSLKALAARVKGKDNLRLQLQAYAGDKSLSASKARRMSLSRALSVRSFLIESGVRSTRIDVRALGNKTTEKPLNRVDVNVVER